MAVQVPIGVWHEFVARVSRCVCAYSHSDRRCLSNAFCELKVHFVHAEIVGLGCRDVQIGRHPQIAIGRATFGPFLVELWWPWSPGANSLPG